MSEFNKNNIIVVVVSIAKSPEKKFLLKCLRNKDADWTYAVTDGNNFYFDKMNNNIAPSFILVNQSKWDNNNLLSDIIKAINAAKKSIIVWTHETNGKSCKQIKEKIKNNIIFCDKFNHSFITCSFMENISNDNEDNYEEEFSNLISETLKKKPKPHLIALSILCQGYLAAHWKEIDNGKKKTLSGLKTWDSLLPEMKEKAQGNQDKTKGQGWWEPVFNNEDLGKGNLKDTRLGTELTSLGKECENSSAIKDLFEAIESLNGKSFCDTNTVIATYNCIKELL